MRLLVVDDSDTSRMLLEVILKGEGFEDLRFADSAREAMEMLKAGEENAPDLVLMDLNMPDMNGIEAIKRIKADPDTVDIPIIMVTASDDVNRLEQAFEAGATDYILKPVSKIELRARVRAVLKLKEEMDRRKARETQLEELTRELRDISNRDGLTGVANRRCFEEFFEREWLRCRRDDAAMSLLMVDIDFFKRYNDTYGHLQGDTCLKTVAQVLKQSQHRPGDLAARYGGEEFVVLLPNTDAAGAMQVAENVRAKLAAEAIPHATSDVSEVVTVSIGVASVVPCAKFHSQALIQAADKALYLAKEGGRNRVKVADAV